jgi:hypothetical protein
MRRRLSREEVQELLDLGFLRYAPDDYSRSDLLLAAAEYPPTDWHDCGRVYFLDAENLAEGGTDKALKEMEAVLVANGVAIGNPHVDYDGLLDVTTLEVNGSVKLLCQWPVPENSSWEIFSRRFFGIVNGLLSASGSLERLYASRLYANDQTGLLLTPSLFGKFSELGIASDLVLFSDV